MEGTTRPFPVTTPLLPEEVKKLIESHTPEDVPSGNSSSTIKVNNATSVLAFLYEKIRNAVEYKDDHLLRRSAIARILKRRFNLKNHPIKIALPLLRELIRARYLKNETVPESKVSDTAAIFSKYQRLLEEIKLLYPLSDYNSLSTWLISILSSDIEENIVSGYKREAFAEVMYNFFYRNLQEKGKVEDEEKRIQLYIAVQRALLKSDDSYLRFKLLSFYLPEWSSLKLVYSESLNEEERELALRLSWTSERMAVIKKTAENIKMVFDKIEKDLSKPTGLRLLYLLRKHTAPFLILRDLIEESPAGASARLLDPARLDESVRRICRKRYEETSARVRRMAVRAVIYIFLTKMVIALILEMPADILIYKSVAIVPLLINAVFPPFLMFLIATTIHVPGEDNTKVIILKIRAVLFGEPYHQAGDRALTFSWQPLKRSGFLAFSFWVFYVVGFIVTFGGIISILRLLEFNPASITIFLFFLCVVALFGYAIRKSATELSTVGKGESLVSPFIDFFFLPILRVGRWLSQEVSKLNFFSFLFDFIIEAPLKSFIEIAEEWLLYVKEKKEELV